MNVADERELVFYRSRRWPQPKWRVMGIAAQIVFFVLTSIAVAAFAFAFSKWLAGVVSIATAEYLIRRFRFGATGVESALWVGGLFALIFSLPGEGKPEALLLFAIACGIAGLRVRNPLITSGFFVISIVYLDARDWWIAAMLVSIALAAIALALLTREWQRPSNDMLLVYIMLLAPMAGAARMIDGGQPAATVPLYLLLAAAELYVGIRYRLRSALIASCVPIVISIILAQDWFHWLALEWKLVLGGATLFALSVAISRALRDQKSGFVITPEKSAVEQTLQVFGSVAFSPHAQKSSAPEPIGGGGSFGGAGSSGQF